MSQDNTELQFGRACRGTSEESDRPTSKAGIGSLEAIAAAYPYDPEAKRNYSGGLLVQKLVEDQLSGRTVFGLGTIGIG